MVHEAQSLQAVLEEQIKELPRLIAVELVRDKLEPLGQSQNEALAGALVAHLLGCSEAASLEELERELDAALPEGSIISFDGEDLARVEKAASDFKNELPEILRRSATSAAQGMLRRYKADWLEWRLHAVAEMDRFKQNLEARWGNGFNLLRMLIELSRDQGIAFHRRASRCRTTRRVHLNTALMHLHARAIQISSEMMALMESGFADGAMARWRTLHEVTCVAMVLDEGGDELAERYLAHELVEAKKALTQYQQCHAGLGYAPFSAREARRIDRGFDSVVAKYGPAFVSDYGWAAAHLGISRPTFRQIEEAAGRAMMRSHYKMASQNVHAGTKGIAHRLSAFDRGFVPIAGASNVGFVEPGQNLGLSLLHFTMLLLPKRWTLDKMALLTALIDLEHQIGPALAKSERSITREERRIRKEAAARSSRLGSLRKR